MEAHLRTSLLLVVCLLLIAPAAFAQQGIYLGGFGGANYLEDSSLRAAGVRDLNVEFDWGAHAGVSLGYRTGAYFSKNRNTTGRLEIELATRRNDVDMIEDNQRLRPAGGTVKVTSLMANSWVDIATDSIFVPFFGLGVGAAQLVFDKAGFVDDKDTRFAYQAGAGVGLPLGNHWHLDLGYRYFATLDATFTDPEGIRNKVDYSTHNITLGVRFAF
jgi:opacity protein-like surface antigen